MKNIQRDIGENKDTKSECMPRESKFKNSKRLSYNSGQLKLIKNLTSESFYKPDKKCNFKEVEKFDVQNETLLCEEHQKELDMVCEESCCMTPVCSSCILFGKHNKDLFVSIKEKLYR